ncbi:hypothetical protein N9R79_11155, partial [Vibrio sp.]|nr:hypothetical protein [Vibrio sp.]
MSIITGTFLSVKQLTQTCKHLGHALIIGVTTVALISPAIAMSSGSSLAYRFEPSSGLIETQTIDMTVSVYGGEITLHRAYKNGEWVLNSHWQDLGDGRRADDGSLRLVSGLGGGASISSEALEGAENEEKSLHRRLLEGDHDIDRLSRGNALYLRDFSFPTLSIEEQQRAQSLGLNVDTRPRFYFVHDKSKYLVLTENGFQWHDRSGHTLYYNKSGQLLTIQQKNGLTKTIERDSNNQIIGVRDHQDNRVITLSYEHGKLVNVSDSTGREVNYHWTGDKLDRFTDVTGHTWTYDYRPIDGKDYLSKITDPETHFVAFTHAKTQGGFINYEDNGLEDLRFSEGSSGGGAIKTSVTSNPMVMVTRATFDDGKWTRYRTHYSLDSDTYTVLMKTSEGHDIERSYDKDGTLARIVIGGEVLLTKQDSLNAQSQNTRLIENGNGQRITQTLDSYKNPTKTLFANGEYTQTTYHPDFDFPVTHRNRQGTVSQFEYDEQGNLITEVHGQGTAVEQRIEYTYNTQGSLTRTRYVGTHGVTDRLYQYQYDDVGHVVQFIDANGHISQFDDYTITGQPQRILDPLGNEWRYQYDHAGRMTERLSPLGKKVQYRYNKNGQLIQRVNLSDDTEPLTVSFTYDSRGYLNSKKDDIGTLAAVIRTQDG